MARKCVECGDILMDDAKQCPNCGCPVDEVNNDVNKEVLEYGKDTEAETTVTIVAINVLKWGKIIGILGAIYYVIMGFIVLITQFLNDNPGYALLYFLINIFCAVLSYFLIPLLGKMIWGMIMVFVNISTTLKRIENLIQHNNGTN